MDISKIIGIILMTAIIIFFAYGIIRQTSNEAEEKIRSAKNKEDQKIKQQKEQETEMSLIAQAAMTLPDSNAAFTLLKSRYGWMEILETIGIFRHHIELLREFRGTIGSLKMQLPDMDQNSRGQEEALLRRQAKEAAKLYFGDEDDWPFVEPTKPTVDTLWAIHNMGFVLASPSEDGESNIFNVEITKKGEKIIKLDSKFSDPNDGLPGLRRAPSFADARKAVSKIVISSTKNTTNP